MPDSPQFAAGVAWDLSDLYVGADDPRIEGDLVETLGKAENFEAKYRGRIADPALSPARLAEALASIEEILETASKAAAYAQLLFSSNSEDPVHGALLQKMMEKGTEVRRRVLFFDLEWMRLPDETAGGLMADPLIARYRHYLERARRLRPHVLSEPEEQVLEAKANTAERAFSRLFDEITARARFTVRRREETALLTEAEALALLHDPDRDVRRAAAEGLTDGLRRDGHLHAFVFNTLIADHASIDRLRRFPDPMASRHLDNETTGEIVEAMLGACERRYDLVARYYRLKKRLLGCDTLFDYDRYAPLEEAGGDATWEEARETVLAAFSGFSGGLGDIVRLFFDGRWIDAEMRPGKHGGAFSHGTVPSVHPYILMNYAGRPRDVMTLAHELGHGVHQYLSRGQGIFHHDTPLTMAETASVMAEIITFRHIVEREADPKRRLAIVAGKIEDTFATVFRQVALTRFEQAFHRARREEGEVPAEKADAIWMEVNRAMFGDSVALTDGYAVWWRYISHFVHTPFYCYAYAFAELLVLSLYQIYKREGESFVPKYVDLLAAGGSDSPKNLLARIGIDIEAPGFWNAGLAFIEEMVAEAEALAGEG